MNRRQFLARGLGVAVIASLPWRGDAVAGSPEAFRDAEVILYDTYAMALYFDGGLGPRTGIIQAEAVLAGEPLEMEFWHGHGGRSHFFTVTPAHLADMKRLKKVTLQTTEVQGHSHKLFVDFGDPRWRVPGAKPVPVPITIEEHEGWRLR